MTTAENPDFTIPDTGMDIQDIENIQDIASIRNSDSNDGFANLKLLGMGGMGVVYEADDPALKRKVALKMLRSPFRDKQNSVAKFIKEAQITARIDHPNIVTVHQLGVNKDFGAYFSMLRIKGETLQNIIRKLRENVPGFRRKYTVRRLVDIFVSGCNGVAAAHSQQIFHCDLKPSNIMVGDRGEVWVLDWGVATDAGSAAAQAAPDSGGKVEGTVAFMAPELAGGKITIPDEKTDIYALGTILYSILTWRDAPFDMSLDQKTLMHQVASGKHLPLCAPDKNLQVELAAICRKAMAFDRKKRYDSVGELLRDLHNYLDGKPVSAYSPNPFYRLLKLCRRRPLIPMTALAAVMTLGIYHLGSQFVEHTENRSKMRQAYSNIQMANEYSRNSMRQWRQLISPEHGIMPLKTALVERNMLLNSNLAMLETFAACDALSGISPGFARNFAANGGAAALKQLLRLQSITGEADSAANTLERFRSRWAPILNAATAHDQELQHLTARIRNHNGSLTINSDNAGMLQRCTLIRPDGQSQPMTFKERISLELPAGENKIFFTTADGRNFAAFFRVNPGMSLNLSIPSVSPPAGYILIPGDHWYPEIPGVGKRLKIIPEFIIAATELSGSELLKNLPANRQNSPRIIMGKAVMTAGDAETYCSHLTRQYRAVVRIPGELELRKSLTGGDVPGKSFYGAAPLHDSIALFVRKNNGQVAVFNPATMQTEPLKSNTLAALRAVIELK